MLERTCAHWFVPQNELKEKVSSGEIIAKGRNDILTQALGTPEHPRRVRALGSFAKISSVFGRKPKIATEMADVVSKKDAEIARLRAELKDLEEEKAKQAGGIDDMDEHDNDDEQSDEEYHTPMILRLLSVFLWNKAHNSELLTIKLTLQTIVVVPVEPRGLVQFGSTEKIFERLDFVDQTMRLFQEKNFQKMTN
ncbi:uncharacterized protein LOC133792561 [Humulus lupulus]|uniref:uncharacterized protein LOC133792561 n=1 Tax=Humulus lupulus TaxID=3486 RepID=UPI002B408457|nr:uncharacterized protein LOC133792561 [Humulus lupulus]